jgi:hypothetical protein
MEKVAKDLGIDPLVPQNWLKFSKEDIFQRKVKIRFGLKFNIQKLH